LGLHNAELEIGSYRQRKIFEFSGSSPTPLAQCAAQAQKIPIKRGLSSRKVLRPRGQHFAAI